MGLTKRPGGYLVEFRVVDNGEFRSLDKAGKLTRWATHSHDKRQAEKVEAQIYSRLLAGTEPSKRQAEAGVLFFRYADTWLEKVRSTLSESGYASYESNLIRYVYPRLGTYPLKSITWKIVKDVLDGYQTEGYSSNTVRLIRAAISTVLTDAAEDGLIPANPILGVRRKRARVGPKAEVRALDWSQLQEFEKVLSDVVIPKRSYPGLLLTLVKTGLRPSEGLALKPGDIDLFNKKLRVERSVTLKGVVKSTKTGETRIVDLSSGLVEFLREYLVWRELEYPFSEWLFPDASGELITERNAFRVLGRVLQWAGLPHFTLYDLRHTFASLLLSSGKPLLYVSRQLGHSKPTMTLQHYARWIPSGDENHVDVLDQALRSQRGLKYE